MAGAQRYLLNRDGRFFARLVVPKDLRAAVGKSELRAPLGPDRRTAAKLLPGAVAQLQHEIAQAERKVTPATVAAVQGRYPLAPDQIALSHYHQRLAFDDQLRNDVRHSSGYVDDILVQRLRDAMAGKLADADLAKLIGPRIERFRAAGNLTAEPGSDEWRQIARALCVAEYEALSRVAERDEGDFTGKPEHPMLVNAKPPEDEPDPVSLSKLWDAYVTSRQALGSMRDGGRRQRLAVDSLRSFLKHDDATKITKKDMAAWLDHALIEKSAMTVSKVYLPTIRSLLRWAVEKDKLPENPAEAIRLGKPKQVQNREKGYTTPEAVALLRFCRDYQPKTGPKGTILEAARVTAAKRWVPLLCAFTGARVAEITQLRREDFRQEEGATIARITPEAGGTKTNQWRDVPLHPQVIEMGFLDYLETIPRGPVFHSEAKPTRFLYAAKKLSNRIGDWLQEQELVPAGVKPSHGWRHRLKTVGREVGIDGRVLDCIQGHAPRTAGDDYGDVTIKTRIAAINRLPNYDLL